MLADLLCLSHLRWGFVYQRPNHLMSRCARGRRVFFIEEPVFDASKPHLEMTPIQDGLEVVTPHLRPGTTQRLAEATQRLLLEELVERMRVRRPHLWFYTPMAIAIAPRIAARTVVYDCMDELSNFVGASPILRDRERDLFRRADLVFTGGQSLYEAKRPYHPRVYPFPSSVEAAHFGKARARLAEPKDQRPIPAPRIGFFGVIDERMDLDLVRSIAMARPDLHFVVIGPVAKIDPATLPIRPNLHWLGPKRYEDLPAYIAGWEVAFMPFARNDATKFISPTKTLEYLAAGRPVVSTSIRDVVRPYGEQGLVRIADEPPAFLTAIDAAIAENATEAAEKRRAACDAVLAQTSWDSTWERMNALIEDGPARR